MSTNKWTEILTGINKTTRNDRGAMITSFSLGGDPHTNAITSAVAAHYNTLSGHGRPSPEKIESLVGEKVSILAGQEGAFGHSMIQSLAGALFFNGQEIGIVPKGSRKNGYSITAMLRKGSLLDIVPGYAGEKQLAERVHAVRAYLPEVEPLTREHFARLPEEGDAIGLVVFGSYQFIEGPIHGAIWLLHSYLPEDDILEGVLIVPPSIAESEHGSIYGHELLRMNVGVAPNPVPTMTLADALDLTYAHYPSVLMCLRAPAPATA